MRYHTFYTRHDLEKIITSPEGYRVGWEIHARMDGVIWRWARIVLDRHGEVHRCERVRDATPQEAQRLSHLLKGDIACRYQGVQDGSPWAFASID